MTPFVMPKTPFVRSIQQQIQVCIITTLFMSFCAFMLEHFIKIHLHRQFIENKKEFKTETIILKSTNKQKIGVFISEQFLNKIISIYPVSAENTIEKITSTFLLSQKNILTQYLVEKNLGTHNSDNREMK